ncbi:hypothetical protein G5I_09897 [Acromyrmex echinatior]|uniref:Uncharacterized protein n=1 Tax=Acromyrmex echinatior TaxID=103372 RepID=F4WVF9_ACREC|nr:hypothetical protein G5I_09897 [Acromyrmex echinatior]
MKGAKRNNSDSIRLPRTDLKVLLEEKGNVVIMTGIATEIPGRMLLVALKSASFHDNGVKSVKTSNSTTNRLEDDIRNGEGIANMQSTFFLSPSPHEIRLSGGKEEKVSSARESDYEAR